MVRVAGQPHCISEIPWKQTKLGEVYDEGQKATPEDMQDLCKDRRLTFQIRSGDACLPPVVSCLDAHIAAQ